MICLRVFLLLTLITGIVYPVFVTGLSSIFFPEKASGQLLYREGAVVGSRLIGQKFDREFYFRGRPSATEYRSAGATNLAPGHPQLVQEAEAQTGRTQKVPPDWATHSASGVDPHISPGAARLQIERVAEARGVSASDVEALVVRHRELPTLGFLGQERINVLLLNLDLDKEYPKK